MFSILRRLDCEKKYQIKQYSKKIYEIFTIYQQNMNDVKKLR